MLLKAGPARADYPVGSKDVPEVVIAKDAGGFKVYTARPRLFFRDTDLTTIRRRIAGEYRQPWQAMVEYLDGRLLARDPAHYAANPYLKSWSYGRNMAFAALVTGNSAYRQWAIRWGEHLAAADPKADTVDDDYRGRLMSLAVAYDWLWPWLSAEQKERWQEAIEANIERNWYFAAKPDFTGGHSRWGNFALAAGLLALGDAEAECREKLLRVRDNWLNGYHPVQEWIAIDGGYHMAWTYSAPYTDARIHALWSSATNECLYYPWREKIPYFFLYGNTGDGTYPNSGDAYSITGGLIEGSDTLAVAAGVFKNRHAAAMIEPSWDTFYLLLYGDPAIEPLAPDDAAQPLPLGRHFRRAGVVIARDRWDERTTHFAFKSSSFYSANHHHRDENSFTLNYRGPLAVDSGYYDSYGSEHWRNYYTRTIAHNAITVTDPQQSYLVFGKPVANDGGQPYRNEPQRLEDIVAGGAASLDGIQRYEHRDDFTYALGDASAAYDPQRVKLARREIVYLRHSERPHPLVVVFDRVESAEAAYTKRFLLHMVEKPVVEGATCVIENGGGRLTSITLLPQEATLRLVGGEGSEFRVGEVNYPPARLSDTWRRAAGSWRLEVSPAAERLCDDFLHVLAVDDIESPQLDGAAFRPITGSGCSGMEGAGWAVVFAENPSSPSTLAYRAGSAKHLIAGCQPNQPLVVQLDGQDRRVTAGPGGCAVFELPPAAAGSGHDVVVSFP